MGRLWSDNYFRTRDVGTIVRICRITTIFRRVKLGWFPVAFWKGPEFTVMPTIALSMAVIATIARFARAELIEVMQADYILTAKAKGISQGVIIIKHALL